MAEIESGQVTRLEAARRQRVPHVRRPGSEGRVSRVLIGRERTRARRAVDALAGCDPAEVARKLGMKRRTVAAILSRRMLPGRTFGEKAALLAISSS